MILGELDFIYAWIPSKKQKVEHVMSKITLPVDTRSSSTMKGPKAAMDEANFSAMSSREKSKWVDDARIMAILGASARTLPSMRSGIRCYLAFAGSL